MSPSLSLTVRPDAVAVLTLDQPGSKANVLSTQMWTELEAAFDALATRTDVRGLVLASAKPGIFIAGADLKLLANAAGPNDPAVRSFIGHGLRVLNKLEALPFPTCAAIDGAALGGGLEVALACLYRVVGTSDKVKLALPEVTLGLIPGWGGTQRLPRICGLANAVELVTTGRILDGSGAESVGLIADQSSDQSLFENAIRLVQCPISMSFRGGNRQPLPDHFRAAFTPPTALTGAAAEAARVMVEGASLPLSEAIKLETEAFLRLAGSPESKRLIEAFFASRKK
jgi:enoyl-CoA hydratase/carnithine racemase